MKIDAIDWETITRAQANRMRAGALAHLNSVGAAYNANQATEEEFTAALQLEEDIFMFAKTGLKPHEHRASAPTPALSGRGGA